MLSRLTNMMWFARLENLEACIGVFKNLENLFESFFRSSKLIKKVFSEPCLTEFEHWVSRQLVPFEEKYKILERYPIEYY